MRHRGDEHAVQLLRMQFWFVGKQALKIGLCRGMSGPYRYVSYLSVVHSLQDTPQNVRRWLNMYVSTTTGFYAFFTYYSTAFSGLSTAISGLSTGTGSGGLRHTYFFRGSYVKTRNPYVTRVAV